MQTASLRTQLLLCGWLFASLPFTHAGAQPFDAPPRELRIMTWNVEWMFDAYHGDNRSKLSREQSAPTEEFWEAKLAAVTELLARYQPDIIALQEIEGAQTLRQIGERLRQQHQLIYQYAFIEGSDSFTEQDVGCLSRSGLCSFKRHVQSQTMYDSHQYYNLSKHLACEFRWAGLDNPLVVLTVHLRATPEAEDLRVRQARLARHWLQPDLAAGRDVILLGDLNTEQTVLSPAAEIAEIVGTDASPQMVDLLGHASNPNQSTHLVLEKQFDRVFVSPSLMQDGPGEDWSFEKIEVLPDGIVRGQPDGEQHWHNRLTIAIDELDISDHYPVMATFILK